MGTRRGQQGQTAVEYLGVLLVVGMITLTLVNAANSWGSRIVCGITGEIGKVSGAGGGGCGGGTAQPKRTGKAPARPTAPRPSAKRKPAAPTPVPGAGKGSGGGKPGSGKSPGGGTPGGGAPGGGKPGSGKTPGGGAPAQGRPKATTRSAGSGGAKAPSAPKTKTNRDSGRKLSTLQVRERYLYNYFVKKGLKPYQAAALAGNLEYESGGALDPHQAQYGGGPGRGIAQWSVDGRWQGVLALAKKMNLSPYTLRVQAAFVWKELTSTFSGALSALRSTKDVNTASDTVEAKYEIAGVPALAQRRTDANKILGEFGP